MPSRVLIIEDSVPSRRLVRAVLEHGGHDVLEATEAEAGLRLAQRERPDLVLLDVQLPGMDGVEACRRLKRHPDTRAIPVVALTALAMPGDRERLLGSGFDRYVSKPIRYRDLLALLDDILKG